MRKAPSFLGKVTGSILMLGILALSAASCAQANALKNKASDASGVGPKCPDLASVESVLSYDFSGNFKIDAAGGSKLKAGTAASLELKAFADQVDADLKAGCAPMAKDLGATGDFKDGKSACEAAAKAIGDVKAKLGANAKLTLVVKEPKCAADLNVYGDCAAKCDVTAKPGSMKVECEPGKLSGSCDAKCEGSCDVEAGAACTGTCSGSCDAEIKGTCSGKCNGKCDGKTSSGASCAGTCEGKCDGGTIKGSCKGKCGGECQMTASAKCDGTCSGKCSAEMKAPKCTGEVKPPQVSADCKAHCDAKVTAKMECTPAKVGLLITGSADAALSAKLQGTIEKNFPLVLKVADGIGDKGLKAAANVQAVAEGFTGTVSAIASSGGGGGNAALIGGQITACLGDTFKGALGAAGSLKADVKVSVDVKASASGSAGGSAGGKAGQADLH